MDQKKVDAAIKAGIGYLRTQLGALRGQVGDPARAIRYDELVLWTFLHAGVPESDPDFQRLLKGVLESKLERTYQVSLQAMILEELDRVRYQWRIHQCAQFLVDNMAKNGQWSYGDPVTSVDDIPTPRKDVESGGRGRQQAARGKKPRVVRYVQVRKMLPGPEGGDNSNSQYAALGLRACHDSGVLVEPRVLKIARNWWRQAQKPPPRNGEPAGQGWCYAKDDVHQAYGSMTAGAVGSLVIYQYMLGERWEADRHVVEGMRWLVTHYSVKENVGPPEHEWGGKRASGGWMYYYYLYALERAGILYGTEKFGLHEWYPEGANVLLAEQQPGGAWCSKDNGNGVWDTCFAILFLRRATRPLEDVATKGSR